MIRSGILGFRALLVMCSCQLAQAAEVASVVTGIVEEIVIGQVLQITGTVQSRGDVLLAATVEGELKWVLEPGSNVAADTIVAMVDDAALRLRREEQLLLAGRADINSTYLTAEVRRLTQLVETNLASETQLAEIASRRDLAEADLAIARARIAQTDEQLSRCRIVSPVGGIVAERLKQSGEYARRGEAIARVLDIDHLEVRILVPVSYLSRLQVGGLLSVEVGQVSFDGTVKTIIQAGDATSQTFEALISVPRQMAGRMLDGQFAQVSVPLNQQGKSLVVPRDAVVLRREGNYVVLVDENNLARRVAVTLGEGKGNLVAVDGDLQVGDRVAVRGMERLNDGEQVRPAS
jgi:RND family efflux transporter MFP subunit